MWVIAALASTGNRIFAKARPQIRRGPRLTEVLLTTDEDDVHAGRVVEFFRNEARGNEDTRRQDPEDHDPDEPPEQPSLSLFVAESGDFLKGYFAAKGYQNATEYDNAQLYWNKWTLSGSGVRAVVSLVMSAERLHARPYETVRHCMLTGRTACK